MKLKPIDVLLVLIVCASIAMIGYKVVKPKRLALSVAGPGGTAEMKAGDLAGTINSDVVLKTLLSYGSAQSFLIEVKPPQSFESSEFLKSFRRSESASCIAAKSEDLSAAPVFLPEVAMKLTDGTLKYFFDTGSPCIRTGQSILFYEVSEEPDKPYFKVLADAKVASLIQIKKIDAGPNMASALGADPQSLTTVFSLGRLAKVGIMTLMELASVRKIADPLKVPIPSFPKVMTLSSRTITNWLKARKNVLILDARSKAEAAKLPIQTSIPGTTIVQMDYGKKEAAMTFDGNRTLTDYRSDPVDLMELQSALAKIQEMSDPWHTLVLAADASDARAIGLLIATQELTSSAAVRAWYYEGVASFNSSIGK
jgi:hypothetical protein